MSLGIDIDDVRSVLLADGWHDVADESFIMDSYEYLWRKGGPRGDPLIMHGGGNSGICSIGFGFKTDDGYLYGPLSAILAVRTVGEQNG